MATSAGPDIWLELGVRDANSVGQFSVPMGRTKAAPSVPAVPPAPAAPASATARSAAPPAGGVFNVSVSSGSLALSYQRGASSAQAVLSCDETAQGGAAVARAWSLNCPAATVAPDAIFANGFEGNPAPTCTPADALADGGREASNPNTGASTIWTATSTNSAPPSATAISAPTMVTPPCHAPALSGPGSAASTVQKPRP